MEHGQYWMWVRRRHEVLKSHFQVSINSLSDSSSWEEKAFAEDHAAAVGSLGGCIWPPRSYSCSFCRREFRSAQALGGHMNVHRRDRARLKQSLIASPSNNNNNNEEVIDNNNNIVNVASTFSAASSTRVSSACNSIVQELQKGQVFGSDSSTAKRALNSDIVVVSSDYSKPEEEAEKSSNNSMYLGSDDHNNIDHHVETGLSVGLNNNNSVFFQNRKHPTSGGEEAMIINCKRPKIGVSAGLPFLVSKDQKWQVLGLKPASSREDSLDLELRLGILPKVN